MKPVRDKDELEETAEEGRLLAVGDIHGCRRELGELLEIVNPSRGDRLVFLGDYLDRGPESRGVIDDLLALGERLPKAVFLKGNHEAMFLDYLAGRNRTTFLFNGGAATLDSYREGGELRIPPAHRAFLESLPAWFETEAFIFVHAGLRPGVPLAEQREEDLLWIREEFLGSAYDWGKTVVFGHTPQPEPLLAPRRIGLDTGAVYGRRLTCCDVVRKEFWSVERRTR